VFHAPAALLPGERAPRTKWIGGWVAPTAGLDTVAKRKIIVIVIIVVVVICM
jgi:hypothetical protein